VKEIESAVQSEIEDRPVAVEDPADADERGGKDS
jgi:hypothetical protein